MRVDGPLGLAARQARRSVPGDRSGSSRRSGRGTRPSCASDRARLLEVGLRSAQGRGGGTEFDALREYTVDDEFRRIDWAATARSGKPIVRTYRAERNQNVIVLLDNGRVMAGQVDGVPRLEHAMDAAMMLTAVATRLGDRCGLVAFDREVRADRAARARRVPAGPGHRGHVRPRAAAGRERLPGRVRRRPWPGSAAGRCSCCSPSCTEEAVGETLLPALPLLLGRHLVIVASVVGPDVAAWATAAPPTRRATPTAAAAAAAGCWSGAARAAARLRGLGATVVDAAARRASPPRLADAYLRVKATGRL